MPCVVRVLVALALVACAAAVDDLPRVHFVPKPFNWMNDPNGLFYDPVHEKYHMMYQYQTPRVWGHAVSEDMLTWKQLPISLENDAWYDKGGVFSGSATILNDAAQTPVLSYSVSTNDMQAIAFPKNRSDPDLVEWVKYEGNPIISAKTGAPDGRDDTTAWLGEDGKTWRMLYGTTQGAIAYTSTDFKKWTKHGYINSDDTTGMWECPDFFHVPGTKDVYVLKASTEGQDYWATGSYNDDKIAFTRSSFDIGNKTQLYDYGRFYASKTFYDPVKDRQILLGWVAEERDVTPQAQPYGWASIMSLPRAITLDEDGVRLKYNLLEEFESLRIKSSYFVQRDIMVDYKVPLMQLKGNQLELIVTFDGAFNGTKTCGVTVLDSGDNKEFTQVGLTQMTQAYMPGVDLPTDDYNVTNVNYTDPHICQKACEDDSKCVAWTYVTRPPLVGSCCLKNKVPASQPNGMCTSGIKHASSDVKTSVFIDTTSSSLNTTDNHVKSREGGAVINPPSWPRMNQLRIIVDHSAVEVYANDGRGVVTRRAYPTLDTANNLFLFSEQGGCHVLKVEGWQLSAI